jgi:hypothetical protein
VLPTIYFLDFTKEWLQKNFPEWEVNNGLIFKSVNSFRIVQVNNSIGWRRFIELHLFGEIVASVDSTLSLIGRYNVQIEDYGHHSLLQNLRKAYIRQFPYTNIEIVHTYYIPTNY